MARKITDKQSTVLKTIVNFLASFDMMPTLQEIADVCQTNQHSASQVVKALQHKGYLSQGRYPYIRVIKLIDDQPMPRRSFDQLYPPVQEEQIDADQQATVEQ